MSGTRNSIHYWKCDRPAALHGALRPASAMDLRPTLTPFLEAVLGGPARLSEAGGTGNHRTYLLDYPAGRAFVRVEEGPEQDGHLAMESRVLAEVARTGVPVPQVRFTDASRTRVPWAVQVIEYFACSDLNVLHRANRLDLPGLAAGIGRAIARWQTTPVAGFGPFDPEQPDRLTGYHKTYAAYFLLNLERHLGQLMEDEFLTAPEAATLRELINAHTGLLSLAQGCLVHKDLALWNILGTPDRIHAFIDWDDAIAGDPTDDLSLLACFHDAATVQAAVTGYTDLMPLPSDFQHRFWLHLLRNLIVKSVIRCRAGYFTEKNAFLMASGQDGPAFRQFTRGRLWNAFHGLRENRPLTTLAS